jgi:hypothetical protein
MTDIMALSLLAGEVRDPCTGEIKSVAEPNVFTHAPFSGNTTYPSGTVTLASRAVEANQILLVTYVSVYLCQTDETVNSIDFGVNHNFYAYWQYTVGSTVKTYPAATSQGQGILNRPCLIPFAPGVTVALRLVPISSALTAASRTLETTVTAYLAPAVLLATFSSMSSQFS